MGEESIRQDKELARAAIKGLTAYAEQIVHQGKDDEIRQVRSLVDALSLYWGMDEKRDWTGEFDERVQQARQRGNIPQRCSNMTRIKSVKGLCRYAEEMASAQGVEEIERILEIRHETVRKAPVIVIVHPGLLRAEKQRIKDRLDPVSVHGPALCHSVYLIQGCIQFPEALPHLLDVHPVIRREC